MWIMSKDIGLKRRIEMLRGFEGKREWKKEKIKLRKRKINGEIERKKEMMRGLKESIRSKGKNKMKKNIEEIVKKSGIEIR